MLVVSRELNQELVIGDPQTIHFRLTDDDRAALVGCVDWRLADLADRLLKAAPGEIVVAPVGIRADRVKIGVSAARDIPVDRRELRTSKVENPRPPASVVRLGAAGIPAARST